MKPSFLNDRGWPWLALLALAGGGSDAVAQARFRMVPEEPQWMKLRVNEVSVGGYAEGTYEQSSFIGSPISTTYERLFVGPLLGLNLDGSIYHPNLLHFRILSEGAYGWGMENISGSTSWHRNEWQYLGMFDGSIDILANKPYNGTVFAGYDHSYRYYDFFSQVTVDTWRYGGRASYTEGPLSIVATYRHRDEEDRGLNVNTVMHDDVLGLTARHDRGHGTTTLNYTYDQYTRVDFNQPGTGIDNTITLADSEQFGSRDQYRLDSSASYTHREAFEESSEEAAVSTHLVGDHRDNLRSFVDLSYDRYQTDVFDSDNLVGQAQLQHRLYDSLTSTLILRGSDYETSDLVSDGYTRRFGGGFSESYIKQLGPGAQLRINNSFLVDHVDVKGIGTVMNEVHSFNGGGGAPPGSFFLNLPEVFEPSIQVWNVSRTQVFIRGIDYQVFQNGAITQIERVTGSTIPESVAVDYRAVPAGTASYEALAESFTTRVELFDRFWGLFGRVNLFLNNAPTFLRIQNVTSFAAGTDISWRWLRVGGEYVVYDSDISPYTSLRFFQSFSFRLDDVSTLGLEFSESSTDYTDTDRQEKDFRFITIYHRALADRWRLDMEGGVYLRQGPGVDQTLATARPGIEYVLGKTTFKVGYQFEYDLYLNSSERYQQQFFLRVKRIL
jgi:hypothetical protein